MTFSTSSAVSSPGSCSGGVKETGRPLTVMFVTVAFVPKQLLELRDIAGGVGLELVQRHRHPGSLVAIRIENPTRMRPRSG